MIIDPDQVPEQTHSSYPPCFQPIVAGRLKKRLGNQAGLTHFGVNLTRLTPGSCSALRHWHTHQDEFIYILEGEATLVTDAGAQQLGPGMAAGFPAGTANGHQLVNRSAADVVYLEIGDRTTPDQATYPDHDLIAQTTATGWAFTHKDGTAY